MEVGGPQYQPGQVCKILPSTEIDPQTIQLVVSHYTDYTVAALLLTVSKLCYGCGFVT